MGGKGKFHIKKDLSHRDILDYCFIHEKYESLRNGNVVTAVVAF